MDNALLIRLSRQAALQRELDVIANNLANINTGGFRSAKMHFEEYLMPGASASQGGGQPLSFARDGKSLTDFSQGSIQQTGNPLNVALDGDGWLAIQTKNGERYTRNGAFTLDAKGTLSAANGDPVQGLAGPITFGPGETDIAIGPDGTISSSAGPKGRLKVVSFADQATLSREGDSLFAGTGARPADNVRVTNGAVEKSNVQAVGEITRMVEVTRAYQQISKIISDGDQLQQNAISTLGQLKN